MPCLYHLDEEFTQQFLEDNLNRRLTPIELNRIKQVFYENDDVYWALMDVMYHAGKDAIDNSKGQWDSIDEDFKNGKTVFTHLDCKEK